MNHDPNALVMRHLGVEEARVVDTYGVGLKRAGHRVRTPDGDVAVLKGGVSFDREHYAEPIAMEAAEGADYTQLPALLAYDIDEQVLISRHIAGDILSEAGTSGEHDAKLHGQMLANLHVTTADAFDKYGHFTDQGLVDTTEEWGEMYHTVRILLSQLYKDNPHREDIGSAIRRPPFTSDRPIAFYHGDAEPHNIIVPMDNTEPPAFIDFQSAAVLDPAFEAARRSLVTAARYDVNTDYDINWRTYHQTFHDAYTNHVPWEIANRGTYERTLLYFFASETDGTITEEAIQRLAPNNTTRVIADTLIRRLHDLE